MTGRARHDCIVVGGGIAGITAAIALATRGVRITLLETRRKLGGRATSFQDSRSGLTIDNCQHVALGCCTNYLELCRLLGVQDKLAWNDAIYWIEPGGRTSVLTSDPLPAPGHAGRSLLGAKFLSVADKLAISRAMTAAMFTDRSAHSGITFGAWLARSKPTGGSIEKFWSPLIVSACNLDVDRVCAATALHVVQEGFLANRVGARMAVAAVPLIELYDPAEAIIAGVGGGGGEIRLGVSVAAIGEHAVTLADGLVMPADRVICAVPAERAMRLVAPDVQARDDRLSRLEPHLEHSPILGVHLTFDRPVMRTPNAVLVGRATQWLFRKDAEGRIVHAVISAADAWVGLPEDEIVERVREDIRACIPEANDARITSARAVKEKLATFAATPAFEAARPATTGSSALILAGDYVQTGWPATMEGAARSGFQAAAAALGKPVESLLVPATKAGVVLRMIGAKGLRDQHIVSAR